MTLRSEAEEAAAAEAAAAPEPEPEPARRGARKRRHEEVPLTFSYLSR